MKTSVSGPSKAAGPATSQWEVKMHKPNMQAYPSEQATAGRPPAKSLTVQAAGGLRGLLGHCSKDRHTTETSDRVAQVERDHSGSSGPSSLLKQGHLGAHGTGLHPDGSRISPVRETGQLSTKGITPGCCCHLGIIQSGSGQSSDYPKSATQTTVNPFISQSRFAPSSLATL